MCIITDKQLDFLCGLIQGSSTLSSVKIEDRDLLDNLYKNCLIEINKNLLELISNNQISFCFPSSPIFYPKSEAEAIKSWEDENATMNIQNLQCTNIYLNHLCFKLENILSYPVTCSVYISKCNAKSFSFHKDKWEGLSIQIFGSKIFTFLVEGSEIEVELLKGDCLRIAKDDLHKASTENFSIHLNIACQKYL